MNIESKHSRDEFSQLFARRRSSYWLLLMLATFIACLAWFAEWGHLEMRYPIFRYAGVIAIIGHAMQTIGCFGLLITPDGLPEETDGERGDR